MASSHNLAKSHRMSLTARRTWQIHNDNDWKHEKKPSGRSHRCLCESGVDGARMAEIARRADVAEGTVYLYYKNKHELLEAVVDRFWRELTKGAIAAISEGATVSQQLHGLASYHLQSLIDDFKIVEITRALNAHGEPGRQLPQIREYVRVFDAIMQRGIDLGSSVPTRQSGKSEMCSMEHWNIAQPWYSEIKASIHRSLTLMRLFEQYRPASQADNGADWTPPISCRPIPD